MATIFVMASCQKQPKTTKRENISASQTSNSSIELDLNKLNEKGGLPLEVKVSLKYDHFFKTAKTYRAYPLKALLEPYIQQLQIDENSASDAIVTFICTDGYKPTLQLNKLLAAKGFIAFCDVDLPDKDQCWPDSLKTKFPPFYLVWQNVPLEDETFPWPYGLVKIKIDKANTVYDEIYPINNERAIAGFNQFRNHCIKCHSINKIGGNVGPDFNYPKNITDYWEVDNMWKYAKNPQSFRYNARMNPITSLTREEFDEIMVYLHYIRSVKPNIESGEKR